MNNLDLIKMTAISEVLTGDKNTIKTGRIPNKYNKQIKELDQLLEYWKKRVQEDY